MDEDEELGAGSASLSRWRIARNFLCGLYASSIKLLVSYSGGACRTRFNTGMFSTMCRFSSDWSSRDDRGLEQDDEPLLTGL